MLERGDYQEWYDLVGHVPLYRRVDFGKVLTQCEGTVGAGVDILRLHLTQNLRKILHH